MCSVRGLGVGGKYIGTDIRQHHYSAPSISAASSSGGQTISPPLNVFQLLRPLKMDWKTSCVFEFWREGQVKPETLDDGGEEGVEIVIEDDDGEE